MKQFLRAMPLVLLLIPSFLFADIPQKPLGYVSDFAGILNSNERQSLESKLQEYDKATTNQIAVVIVQSLEGNNLEDYSMQIAEKWKVGQKSKDNGVIVLIALEERKIRIEVGYGLEKVLPDGLCGQIIKEQIAPEFKKKNFYAGIDNGINAIMAGIKGEYKESDQDKAQETKTSALIIALIIVGIVVLFIIIVIVLAANDGFDGGGGIFVGGGSWSSGDSSSGSGGFGGFGGGGFGGGGASGGW